MIRLTLVAVGRLKEPYWRDAAEEYRKRLTRYATLEVAEVADRDLGRGGPSAAMAAEADDILKTLPEAAYPVALDAAGRERTSEELAAWLDGLATAGTSHVAFLIGGSAGLDPRVTAVCRERLSLSCMTLPHQLARVVLLEQLYRAFRIQRGEPYHL